MVRRALEALKVFHRAATKLGSLWRSYFARRNYKELLVVRLCAVQVQRWYRGRMARKAVERILTLGGMSSPLDRVEFGKQDIERVTGRYQRTRDAIVGLERVLSQARFEKEE